MFLGSGKLRSKKLKRMLHEAKSSSTDNTVNNNNDDDGDSNSVRKVRNGKSFESDDDDDGDHVTQEEHIEIREKQQTHSKDLLSATQYTAYLSSIILRLCDVRVPANMTRDATRTQSRRRLEAMEALFERLQYQHYTREQRLLGLQATSATGNAVTDAAIRAMLEYMKQNVQRSVNGRQHRWSFLDKSSAPGDISMVELREFSLVLKSLVRCAVLMAQHRDDISAGRDLVKTQEQHLMAAMVQDGSPTAPTSTKQKSRSSKRLTDMSAQTITSDLISVFNILPKRVKCSHLVAESLYELLTHCGSQLRFKYVEMAEKIARTGMLHLTDSIDIGNDQSPQERTATLFSWSLALIPRFKQNQDIQQEELITLLVQSLNYLLDMCFSLVEDRAIVLGNSFAQSLARKSITSVSDKRGIDIADTIFRFTFKDGFAKLESYEFMRMFKAVNDCLQKCLTQETPFVFSLDLAMVFACLTKAFLLDESLMAQSTMHQPLLSESFYQIIPYIHQSCLRSLSCLIVSCKTQLAPLVNSISDLLVKELKDCSTQKVSMSLLQLYSEITRCISLMCQTYGAGVSQRLAQRVLPMLLEQLQLQYYGAFRTMVSERDKRSATLDSFSERLMNKKTKKKRKRDEAEKALQEYHISQKEYEMLLEMTLLTLVTVNDIMVSCRVFVTSGRGMMEVLACLADLIVFLVAHLEEWFEQHTRSILHNNTRPVNELQPVIEQMYDCLLSCLLATSSVNSQSPFIVQATRLFRKGASSYLPQLVSKCTMALNVLESHLHPRSAPLYIPSSETVHTMFLNAISHKTKLSTGFSSLHSFVAPSASSTSFKQSRFEDNIDADISMDEDSGDDDYEEKMTRKVETTTRVNRSLSSIEKSVADATQEHGEEATENVKKEELPQEMEDDSESENDSDSVVDVVNRDRQLSMDSKFSETTVGEMSDDDHSDHEDEIGNVVIRDDDSEDSDDSDHDDLEQLEDFTF